MTIKVFDKCVNVEVMFDPEESNVTIYVDKQPICAAHFSRSGNAIPVTNIEYLLSAEENSQIMLTKTDDEIERDAAMYHAATGQPAPSIQSDDME